MNKQTPEGRLDFLTTDMSTEQNESEFIGKAYSHLRDIFTDRGNQNGEDTEDETEKKINLVIEEIGKLTPEEQEKVQTNLNLVRTLNGHAGSRLRELCSNPQTPEAEYLGNLWRWTLVTESNTSILQSKAPSILTESSDEVDLTERLTFLEHRPATDRARYRESLAEATAEALGTETDTKWMGMVEDVFTSDQTDKALESLLTEIGFIPTELLTKKKFKSVGGGKVVEAINVLREIERQDNQIARVAKNERAKLINHLFISKNANSLRRKGESNVTLDANGIFINLKNFHTHLPYGLVTPETIQAFEEDSWTPDRFVTEIALRRADENSCTEEKKKLADEQVVFTARRYGYEGNDPEEALKVVWNLVSVSRRREDFWKALVSGEEILPDRALEDEYSSLGNRSVNDHAFILLRDAERMSADIVVQEIELDWKNQQVLGTRTEEDYRAGSKVINSPGYYNVSKIVSNILEQNIEPNDKGFFAYRGEYKKGRSGDQHSYLAICLGSSFARVLINEKKQLSEQQRKKFNELPSFSRERYRLLETALLSFEAFTANVNYLFETDRRLSDFMPNDREIDDIRPRVEAGLFFVLQHVSERYLEISRLYEATQGRPFRLEDLSPIVSRLRAAEYEYSKFLYEGISSTDTFEQKFSPEVHTTDLNFNNSFVHEARARVGAFGVDDQLSATAEPIRIVSVEYRINDPSQTIPFHIEESCLDALRVDRQRPLINVIGGAKHVGTGQRDVLSEFSIEIMQVAHDERANVFVPGTQSGIGLAFGAQNSRYRSEFGHLPMRDQAHVMAISPGGNTFFPGNKWLSRDVEQNYAITPVDSIITPTEAAWDVKGLAKRSSPYRTHVAYMESLYRRLSHDQPHVMVVGNGGLYSIMEVNETLGSKADLILVKDSGRFAEVSSLLLEGPAPANSVELLDILHQKGREDVVEEFLRKDFGQHARPVSDDEMVYREFFYQFLRLAYGNRERIFLVNLDELGDVVKGSIARQKEILGQKKDRRPA
jgi:hypothetical protein